MEEEDDDDDGTLLEENETVQTMATTFDTNQVDDEIEDQAEEEDSDYDDQINERESVAPVAAEQQAVKPAMNRNATLPKKVDPEEERRRMAELVAKQKSEAKELVLEGPLKKKSPNGVLMKMWQVRYFKLYADILQYYKKQDDLEAQGTVPLFAVKGVVREETKKKGCRFDINVDDGSGKGRTFSLQTETPEECDHWVETLNRVIARVTKQPDQANLNKALKTDGKFWKDTKAIEEIRTQASAAEHLEDEDVGGDNFVSEQAQLGVSALRCTDATGDQFEAFERRKPLEPCLLHVVRQGGPMFGTIEEIQGMVGQLTHPHIIHQLLRGTCSDAKFALYRPAFNPKVHSLQAHLLRLGKKPIEESIVRIWAIELISALSYLHDEGLSCVALSSSTVCVDSDGHVCMSDLLMGLPKERFPPNVLRPEYQAPDSPASQVSDWYSLAVLLCECLTGSVGSLGQLVQTGQSPVPVSGLFVEFLRRLGQSDCNLRLGANGDKEVQGHPLFLGTDWSSSALAVSSSGPNGGTRAGPTWALKHMVGSYSSEELAQAVNRLPTFMKTCSLRLQLIGCQNLEVPADASSSKRTGFAGKPAVAGGSSLAPYCAITCEGNSVKTTVKNGADCTWNESFTFDLKEFPISGEGSLIIEVFAGQDKGAAVGLLIGSVTLPFSVMEREGAMTGWFSVVTESGAVVGELALNVGYQQTKYSRTEQNVLQLPFALDYCFGYFKDVMDKPMKLPAAPAKDSLADVDSRLKYSLDEKKKTNSKGEIEPTASDKLQLKFQKDGFNLDLSYVTSRIIVYAAGDKADVVPMLQKYHANHFKVYNFSSELPMDPAKFTAAGGQYEYLPFDDHNAPPLQHIMHFCLTAAAFLDAHPQNVIAVSCKQGKGRAGCMLACFLVFARMVPDAKSALVLFTHKRTVVKAGVTIPSQRRTVEFFEQYVVQTLKTGVVPSMIPSTVRLSHIRLIHIPNFSTTPDKVGCTPFFIVKGAHPHGVVLYDHKVACQGKLTEFYQPGQLTADIGVVGTCLLHGDVKFIFYALSPQGDQKMFW